MKWEAEISLQYRAMLDAVNYSPSQGNEIGAGGLFTHDLICLVVESDEECCAVNVQVGCESWETIYKPISQLNFSNYHVPVDAEARTGMKRNGAGVQ